MQNKLAMQASKNIFVKNFALNLTSIDTVEVILSDWRDTDAGMTLKCESVVCCRLNFVSDCYRHLNF